MNGYQIPGSLLGLYNSDDDHLLNGDAGSALSHDYAQILWEWTQKNLVGSASGMDDFLRTWTYIYYITSAI